MARASDGSSRRTSGASTSRTATRRSTRNSSAPIESAAADVVPGTRAYTDRQRTIAAHQDIAQQTFALSDAFKEHVWNEFVGDRSLDVTNALRASVQHIASCKPGLLPDFVAALLLTQLAEFEPLTDFSVTEVRGFDFCCLDACAAVLVMCTELLWLCTPWHCWFCTPVRACNTCNSALQSITGLCTDSARS